jgi:hypothetical protein
MKEFKNTQLILVGDTRLGELFTGYNVDCMLGVPYEFWPMKLGGLALDVGLAPLVDNKFNRCKSNIKWQEYSIAKVPGIFSEIVYGQSTHHIHFDGVAGMTATTQDQWYMNLRNYIICENLRLSVVSHAYSIVKSEYNLGNNIGEWIEVYNKLTQ